MRKAHLTGVGTRTIQYDAERHLVSVNNNGSAVSFTYNASGLRVQSTWPSNPASFLYDPNGTWVGNNASGAWSSSAVYLGLRPLAFDGGGAAQFLHVNALDSTTMETSYSGGVSTDVLFYPWGEMWKNPVQTDYQFAGTIWMDGLSSADFATYRLYRYDLGRWLSPDPAGMMAVDIKNPQTLNRYAYVVDSPLSFTDPLGLDCVYLNDAGTGIEDGGINQQIDMSGCGQSGGFWVEGTVTDVEIGGDAETVTLTGTTNGTDTTTATYQQATTVDVGQYLNISLNNHGHIALGLPGQVPLGLNPKSDTQLALAMATVGSNAVVPGAVKPQVGGQLLRMIHIPASGMQGQMLENAMAQSAQNPPMYAPLGQIGCNCGIWAQQMLGDAGINSGPPAPMPGTLMEQLHLAYPQAPQQ